MAECDNGHNDRVYRITVRLAIGVICLIVALTYLLIGGVI